MLQRVAVDTQRVDAGDLIEVFKKRNLGAALETSATEEPAAAQLVPEARAGYLPLAFCWPCPSCGAATWPEDAVIEATPGDDRINF